MLYRLSSGIYTCLQSAGAELFVGQLAATVSVRNSLGAWGN